MPDNLPDDPRARSKERLSRLKEIERDRPCKKCFYYNPVRMIRCTCGQRCDFEHSMFKPFEYYGNYETE